MAMELQALDAAGRQELDRRVQEMQSRHAQAVLTLTTQEERLAYVEGIPPAVSKSQWCFQPLFPTPPFLQSVRNT